MSFMVAIRGNEATIDVEPDGVNMIVGDGPLILVFEVGGSELCGGCGTRPMRALKIDDSGIIEDGVNVAHEEACPIAFCEHGKLRSDDNCLECKKAQNGGT